MTKITIDKISSVTKNLDLKHTEDLAHDMPCDMGTVLAVQVLDDKHIYNELELPSGRLSKLKKGDIIAVALGQRMALKGFVGRLPTKLVVDDIIHLLNFGGVAGICTSANTQEVGEPLRVRVLGGVARDGKTLNIGQAKTYEASDTLDNDTPLIIITGTSMDSGKTTVATEITKTLTHIGMNLAGAKLTGVGARRDLFKMCDYGVYNAVSFVDCGVTSTANINGDEMKNLAKGALNYLSKPKDGITPDAILIEFGDGVMGKYGVADILKDPKIQANVRLHIGCAGDPISAIGLAEKCEALGLPLDVISGPVTDNQVGKDIVKEHMKAIIPYNAFSPTSDWLDLVIARWAVQKDISNAA
jgi:hypothetical protein